MSEPSSISLADLTLITHVAIRFQGKVWALPKPNRHHHVIAFIVEQTGVDHVNSMGEDQGFVDANGQYLTRRQALVRASFTEQILDRSQLRGDRLYSEDLW